MMIAAHFYDGRSARLHSVDVNAADGFIVLRGDVERSYAAGATRIAEPFAHAPTVLYFDDGARCEVPGAEPGQALRDALGYRPSRVVRLTDHTWAALLALALLVALLFATVTWGVPALATRIADGLPPSVDRALGETALKALNASGKLEESRLSDQWQAEVRAVLPRVVPADMRVRLLLRNSRFFGPNALALPDGTIIMTDQMVRLIVGPRGSFGEAERAQLAGILAHEIGHVRMRHSTRMLASSSLTAALAASVFGDFSTVAALPAVLLRMSYSRDKETEADEYAIAVMRARGISTLPLADLHDRLAGRKKPDSKQGAWVSEAIRFVASHPVSAERSARLRAAAQAPTNPQ
ncbi:M48 family metallopeptidase [Massilia sp. Leaf139]|uniref:M48 family metallopeptidase n=1 Tax=Massilia sp. Leaf139 TaxID=1736272 RepID=UPI0006F1E786|nr:M48 family metallopeptidase [Massilia sp. Leaf139]